MKRTGRQLGFTMIEVLVAVSIVAGLTAMVWAAVENTFETRDYMTDQFERYQIARIALDRMKEELASAYLAGPTHGGKELPKGEWVPPEQTDQNQQQSQQQQIIGRGPQNEPIEFGMVGQDDEIHFTTLGHRRKAEGEKAGYHAEISYFIESDMRDGEIVDTLMRREDISPDGDIEEGGTIFRLIPSIKEIKFEYWDPGPVEIGTIEEVAEEGEWVDEWDTDDSDFSGRLPTRIRITLVLPPKNPRASELKFRTQVDIGATQVLEF
jgi:prepilin-type N-terminal cleavage/methylation domain-containing protein